MGSVVAAGTGNDPKTVDEYTHEDLDVFGFTLSPAEMTTIGG
jgi:hypothetical protein